jgi:uncharacterized protein (DUF2267 family)
MSAGGTTSMQATQIESLERSIQKTNEWLKAIQERMGAPSRQQAYMALRATLHALRDRLQPNEAVQLGAQLPALVRGVYYEGWRLIDKPLRIRDQDEFLGVIAVEAGSTTLDVEAAARAVFHELTERVTPGEIDDVKSGLPEPIRSLWP